MYTEEQAIELASDLESLGNGDIRYVVEFMLANKHRTIEEMLKHTNFGISILIASIEK